MTVKPESLPFDEAINYFRGKVSLPTRSWTDLWQGMHARAFVIAGAMKTELLADLRGAVDSALAEGTTLQEFRKTFDAIVTKYGWSYKGTRGWRTSVIFHTNLRTAYAAGRYRQMTNPDLMKLRPFWEYRHGDSVNPRELHLSWDKMVLQADDPWWETHYPPNGWGCSCKVYALSERDLERLGKDGPDSAPDDGSYKWTNKKTGEVHSIPKGIDPGWSYNVGEAAWGRTLSTEAMAAWQRDGTSAWERLTAGTWKTCGRPEKIDIDQAKAKLDFTIARKGADIEKAVAGILGGEEKIYSFTAGGFRYDVLINAKALASHIDAGRLQYLPFLPETMEDPFEVWLSFERHKGRGEVVLRQRIIKAVATGKKEGMLVVTNAVNGIMEAWTVVPVGNMNYLNRQRAGKLIWHR